MLQHHRLRRNIHHVQRYPHDKRDRSHQKDDSLGRESELQPDEATHRNEYQKSSTAQTPQSDGAVLAQPPREGRHEQSAEHQSDTRGREYDGHVLDGPVQDIDDKWSHQFADHQQPDTDE